eukprot:CAMPEP_0181093648 /NCGR_PEP_ID=MMETSP1071-20121207/9562_1 /TAXON_ID=35127 /ORGANISM="Thalassiosira sp., Strain NH16" /LENGTH=331 /DNA_ID=CAMNT_0023175905 /DNA_START=160 /DNA_END=1155 /DNA_ORIENTATION=-
MKVALLSTVALAAISTGLAFAPPSQSHRQCKTRSLALNSFAISATPPKLSNPYKSLPWNTEREEKRKQRRLTHENAALFRELGLPEDATYEDVAAKTKHLISLTEDLPKNEAIKKKIKIEIARDKIYQIRLNERITGVRAEQEDAARVSKLEDEGLEGLAAMTSDSVDDIIKPKKKLRIPVVSGMVEYFQSIYTPPDEKWRKRCITVWGLSTLGCLVVPSLTEGFARMNWLPAGGMMGFRGMPDQENLGQGYNPFRGKRNKKHNVQAMGISMMVWVVARGVAETVVEKFPAMAASRSSMWFKFAITQAMLGTTVAFIQTYKEGEEGADLMI